MPYEEFFAVVKNLNLNLRCIVSTGSKFEEFAAELSAVAMSARSAWGRSASFALKFTVLSLLVAKVYVEFKSKIGIEEMEQHGSAGCSNVKKKEVTPVAGEEYLERVSFSRLQMCRRQNSLQRRRKQQLWQSQDFLDI